MAYKLIFPRPYRGMDYIWNVSDRVGDSSILPNYPNDVALVSLLIEFTVKRIMIPGKSYPPACLQSFRFSGQMDVNLAYWIREFNAQHTKRREYSEEGHISRAKKTHYSSDTWTIVKLNEAMMINARAEWENLPNDPRCSPALKHELLTKTNP